MEMPDGGENLQERAVPGSESRRQWLRQDGTKQKRVRWSPLDPRKRQVPIVDEEGPYVPDSKRVREVMGLHVNEADEWAWQLHKAEDSSSQVELMSMTLVPEENHERIYRDHQDRGLPKATGQPFRGCVRLPRALEPQPSKKIGRRRALLTRNPARTSGCGARASRERLTWMSR